MPIKKIENGSLSKTYPANSKFQKNKKVVLISGDEEYRSEEALPQLAKILAIHHGFDCQVLFPQNSEKKGIINPNYTQNIPDLENLEDADLMILFTRFRALPDSQMQHFQNYLEKGKPIIALRTATHAFNFKDTTHNFAHWGNYYNGEKTDWKGGFGQKILGTNWHSHHGQHKHQSTRGILNSENKNHPIIKNIEDGAIWGATDVYGMNLPLPDGTQILVYGQVINRAGEFEENDLFFGMKPTDDKITMENPASKNKYNPNEPLMPIIWEKSYQIKNGKKGKSITSTIGASTDLLNEELRRVLTNSVYYLMELGIPKSAKVEFVGDYQPSQFGFKSDEYWEKKELKISAIK